MGNVARIEEKMPIKLRSETPGNKPLGSFTCGY
jgi:hypothetical protein